MKFKISIDEFKNALNEVKDTIGSEKLSREGLRLLADAKGRVRLTTNDGSYATDTWVDADVETGGETIIVAKIFYQYFSKLEGKEVEISMPDGDRIMVKTKRGKQIFMSLADEKFGGVTELEPTDVIDVSGRTFKQLVNGVSFATDSKSKTQAQLEGIHLISNGKITEFVATNHLTIASVKKKLAMPKLSIIIGAKSLTRIARTVRDDEKLSLLVYERGVSAIQYNDTIHFSPLFEGSFPDVSRVLKPLSEESPNRTFATVDRYEFIALLERASYLSEATAYMKIDGMKLSIKGNNPYGNFDEFMFASTEGVGKEAKFHVKALTDIARNIQDDTIEIGIEEGKPITLRPDSKLKQVCLLASMA